MSSATSAAEVSDKDDILWKLVKNNEFLQYEHSIEQIKPSRFDFSVFTEHTDDDVSFSNFGFEVIQDYLHIGLINEDFVNGKVKCQRVLLLVWPNFVPLGAYQNYKLHLVDIKKIKTLVFLVPESVFRKYSEGNSKLHEIVAATAILTPAEDWKLLERAVISSFYHLAFDKTTSDLHGDIQVWKNYPLDKVNKISSFYHLAFDKATSDLHGDIQVWKNYPRDKVNKVWKQLFYICCGPQGLAYLVKRMLKRNWAKIARNSISSDKESNGYSVFCTGGVVQLIVEWTKQFFKPVGVVKFLEELNSVKPVLSASEIADKVRCSFSKYMSSSKKYRCSKCPYKTKIKAVLDTHMRMHTGETPYVCDVCGSAHKQLNLLNAHKIKYHTGDYQSGATMKYHVSVHEKKGNVHFQCYKCSFVSKEETGLMQHAPTHSKDLSFDCTVCYRKHDNQTALIAHSRNHSKDKPFNCHICEMGFLLKSNLRRHYTTHSDSRTMVTCPICIKNLGGIVSLRTHLANKHGQES